MPPGSHTLKASLVGYGPVEIQNVVVSVDLTTDLDFELSTQTIDMGTIKRMISREPGIMSGTIPARMCVRAD